MVRHSLKWFLPLFLAGAFTATPSAFAQGANDLGQATRRQNQGELRYQRQRLKQSGKNVRAEARQYKHPAPPKAERHRMRKVQQHTDRENPNLKLARKQSRSRRTAHHPIRKK